MKTLNLKEMEVIEGGIKFWGSELESEAIDDNSCPSGLRAANFKNYYVFGIRTSHELESIGNCLEF